MFSFLILGLVLYLSKQKTKRRQSKTSSNSKQKNLSSVPSMRQMTLTQLFDPIESPKSTVASTPVKQEPNTPSNNTTMFMPESLIGLAQPSESTSDNENDEVTSFLCFNHIEFYNFRII